MKRYICLINKAVSGSILRHYENRANRAQRIVNEREILKDNKELTNVGRL